MVSTKKSIPEAGPHVSTYRATIDVPEHTLAFVTRILAAHPHRTDRRRWQRAATVYVQAVMALRWFRDGTAIAALARDRVSVATAYRLVHKGIDVIAAHAEPARPARTWDRGQLGVCLPRRHFHRLSTRCRERSGHDQWHSGKHSRHGGNIQVLTDPAGYPIGVRGCTRLGARPHRCSPGQILGALYNAAAAGMPTIADKGHTGAGIGVHVPTKGPDLDAGTRCRDRLLSAMHAPAERANALLKTTWKPCSESVYARGGSVRSLLRVPCFFTYKHRPSEKTSANRARWTSRSYFSTTRERTRARGRVHLRSIRRNK